MQVTADTDTLLLRQQASAESVQYPTKGVGVPRAASPYAKQSAACNASIRLNKGL
jgi:hypothetical protein